jgi:hypothetical protein
MQRIDYLARCEIQTNGPRDTRQDNDRFLQGKAGADANTRTGAEGQVGETVDSRASLR